MKNHLIICSLIIGGILFVRIPCLQANQLVMGDPYAPVMGLTLLGNEPFWKIDLKDHIAFSKNVVQADINLSCREIKKVENGWELKVSEADVILIITIKEELGFDDMSGQVYPYSVKLVIKVAGEADVTYNGVGIKTGKTPLPPHPEIAESAYSNFKDITNIEVYRVMDWIKFAINFNQPARMAKYLKFPLKYNLKPGKSIIINTSDEFIAQYNKLITEDIKSGILQIEYSSFGESYQGIFPDGGTLWLSSVGGKPRVFVINAGN